MVKTCQQCINWIEEDNLLSCDFNKFIDIKYNIGILYVPGMFDCDYYETIEDVDIK